MATDLFKEVQALGLVVEEISRTVTEQFVWIMGEKFEVEDLYELLAELNSSPSHVNITDRRMLAMLKSLGIVGGTSGSWGTSVTSEKKLMALKDMVEAAMDDHHEKKKEEANDNRS